MILNIFYIVLALIGIGFLIFIHELGHYWMARRVGIKVEVFSIGFGKPIYEWEYQGVKWKICWLIFGGYVRMAGTEKKGSIEPYQVPDGFFGKSPWARIKVSIMGPLVNIVFALFAFTLLWAVGGRVKRFQEYTNHIGWVDQDSELYKQGVRAGDEIETFNGHAFNGFSDLMIGAFLDKCTPVITGQEIDYFTQTKQPFTYAFSASPNLKEMERAFAMRQSLGPASYLIYNKMPDGKANSLEGSPMKESGISYGDRILWADGELIFSRDQLVNLLNEPRVLLTVERDGQTFLTRVPRLKVGDLRLESPEMGELDDWRFEAGLSPKIQDLYFIPYNLTQQGVVEGPLAYVDERSNVKEAFAASPRTTVEIPLMPGDRIIAADGLKIQNSYDLLSALQMRHIQIIVQKMAAGIPSWKKADEEFANSFAIAPVQKIANSIGTNVVVQAEGDLRLLRSVTPIEMKDFPLTPAERAKYEKRLADAHKEIESLTDEKQRVEARKQLEEQQKRLLLGLQLQDQSVRYNPSPFVLFQDVLKQMYKTFSALVTGFLSPKNLMGPVGIVQVIQTGWSEGVREALYWLGMISLNLGILNLLPIPVLDGGYILLSLIECVTRKPLKAKTMEWLLIPFIILLVAFFIYVTFHDIGRIFR